jgi:acyl phosphate:glycerol-3-phosphate acyltransferase
MAGLAIVCCLIAFVVGGIPFGYLAGRYVLHDDIRSHGSGNIGATNVARVIGWKWGAIVLVLDAIKGLVPTLAAQLVLKSRLDPDRLLLVVIATGVCTIAGHMYPVWLRLRGGKGVATAMGVVVVISPIATVIAVGIFLLVALSTRIVALASIAASLSFSVTQLFLLGKTAVSLPKLPLTLFSVIVPVMIVWRHRANIARIWRGEERRMGSVAPENSIKDSGN